MNKAGFFSTLFAAIVCVMLFSIPATANQECISYAKPYASSAKLLAVTITSTADALVSVNKRANEHEITSFNDFVADMKSKADEMSLRLNRKAEDIMLKAKNSNNYGICKQELREDLDALKAQGNRAKELLEELKKSTQNLLDELKGAFFG